MQAKSLVRAPSATVYLALIASTLAAVLSMVQEQMVTECCGIGMFSPVGILALEPL